MPHVILEHSANLQGIDYQNLFSALYSAILRRLPDIGTCKLRAVPQVHYFVGAENGENAFAFLRVLMKPGAERTAQVRERLAQDLIPILKKAVDPVKKNCGLSCYPTLEVGLLSEQYYWIEE
ncbi:MAG: hypothetical protein QM752_00900 [Gammaproteobacteria bacterium]